jgi:hypothetical protein
VAWLVCGALAAGCGDNTSPLTLAEGCQPLLGGHHCALPYPSDFFRVPDPDTATGFRIAPAGAAKLASRLGENADVHSVFQVDGFSRVPKIVAVLPDAVSAAGLTHLTGRLEDSLAADARTIIVGEDGTLVPHHVDLDPRAEEPDRQAIVLHPLVGLEPGQRYVVALRRIERPDGSTANPAEGFRRLRDGERTGARALDALAPHYQETIFPLLEAAGWERGDLQLAWDFTVGSAEEPVADMLRVRELALAWLDENEPAISIDEVLEDPFEDVWLQVRGTVTAPLFTTNDEPGALLFRDASGQVAVNGVVSVPFLVQVPASLQGAEGPGAALAFGHGFFGSVNEIEGARTRTIANSVGAVMFGIDWVGMSSDDLASVLLDLSGEPARVLEFGDRVHQAMANWIVFSAAIRGALADRPELQREGGQPVFAAEPLGFLGISQGHILGGTMTAVNPLVDRIALNVGGAGFSHMMFRARPFEAFLVVIDGSLDDPLDQQLFTASLQVAFDRFEPASYARFLTGEPLPGTPAARPLLLQAGLGDTSVPNLGTFLHARLLGIPVTEPSPLVPFGLETATPPVEGAALTLWDYGIDWAELYQEMRPPEADNPVHDDVRIEPTALDQLARFLATGLIEHPCDGPCDPD